MSAGLFNSTLNYCLPVWSSPRHQERGMHQTLLQSLQRTQNRVMRVKLGQPPWSRKHVPDLLFECDSLSVNQVSALSLLKMRKKIIQTNQPEYLAGRLVEHERTRDTRSSVRLDSVVGFRLNVCRESFVQSSGNLWNELPVYVRDQPKLGDFCQMCRAWVLQNVSIS